MTAMVPVQVGVSLSGSAHAARVATSPSDVRRTDALDACAGVRELDTRLAGICLICDRSWSKSERAIEPAAAKGEREVWGCLNFVQVKP